MSIQKANINKFVKDKPSISSYNKNNSTIPFSSNPMFAIAQQMVDNMPTKYKVGIASVVICILTGIGTIGYGIFKLITITL